VDCIQFDLHKGETCALSTRVRVFLAVMVCEVEGEYLVVRKAELEHKTACEATCREWSYSEPILAREGNWHWCFGCGPIKPYSKARS